MSNYRGPYFVVREEASRRLQKQSSLPVYPVTPTTPATVQAFAAVKAHIRHQKRYERRTLEIDSYPATPEILIQSGYPGSGGVKAFRSGFRFQLQTLGYPDEYPETSAPAAPLVPAFSKVEALVPKPTAQYLQTTGGAGVFKLTDPAYYTGWYPGGFAAQKAHKIWFDRKHLKTPPPVTSPASPGPAAVVPPSYFSPKQHQRHEKRSLLKLPTHADFERTPAWVVAFTPVPTIKRRETARILRFPERLDTHPTTAIAAAVPPSYFAPTIHRRHGKAKIVRLKWLSPQPVAVTESPFFVAITADQRGIAFKGETGHTQIFMDNRKIQIK